MRSLSVPVYAIALWAIAPLSSLAEVSNSVQLDPFEVTGTRLGCPLADSPANFIVLDHEALERTGRANFSEILRELPELAATGITENVAISSVRGTTAPDLRGLGAQNTLLLVDGRRVTSSANSFGDVLYVDLNRFAPGAIERVEILKGGASAVYGADAVAGVINIITRRAMRGGELRLAIADTFQTDALEFSAGAVQGATRGNLSFTINADYFRRNALANRDRWFSRSANLAPRFASTYEYFARLPAAQLASYDGRSLSGPVARIVLVGGQVNGQNGVNLPGLAPGAAIVALPGSGGAIAGTLGAASPAIIAPFLQSTGGQFNATAAASFVPLQLTRTDDSARNLYNFNQDEWLVPAAERASFGARADYVLPGGATLFGDVTAMRNRSRTEFFAASITAPVPRTNFYNPFGVDVTAGWRLNETGPRRSLVEDDSWSLVAGLRSAPTARTVWEIAATHSANTYVDSLENAVVASRVRAGLARSDASALNPFGGPEFRHDPALIRALTTRTWTGGKASLTTLDAQAATPLAELPTGPLRAALYAETRQERFSADSDPLYQAGELLGQGQTGEDVSWSRDLAAFAAELHVPVLRGAASSRPLVALESAGRWEKLEGGFASGVHPSVGLVFRPHAALVLRASWAETFRAPTLPELFSPQSEGFANSVPDPRRPVALTRDDYDGPNVSRLVRGGGNPKLEPEEGRVAQIGATWSATRGPLSGLSLEATWYRYELEDVISGIGPAQALNDELGALGYLVTREPGTETYTNTTGAPIPLLVGANGLKRDLAPGETATVPGRLRRIDTFTINLARRRLLGWDFAARYTRDLGAPGRVTLVTGGTYTEEFSYATDRYSPFVSNAGQAGNPRWRARSTLDWSRGGWSAGAAFLYTASSGDLPTYGSYMKPYRVLNLQVSYTSPLSSWLRGAGVTLGIDDLFEDAPPLINDPPIGYSYSAIARPQGRSWRLALKQTW